MRVLFQINADCFSPYIDFTILHTLFKFQHLCIHLRMRLRRRYDELLNHRKGLHKVGYV